MFDWIGRLFPIWIDNLDEFINQIKQLHCTKVVVETHTQFLPTNTIQFDLTTGSATPSLYPSLLEYSVVCTTLCEHKRKMKYQHRTGMETYFPDTPLRMKQDLTATTVVMAKLIARHLRAGLPDSITVELMLQEQASAEQEPVTC